MTIGAVEGKDSHPGGVSRPFSSGLSAAPAKPRLKYADVFRLNLDELEFEKTPLLFEGKQVTYMGHHYDSVIWLSDGRKTKMFRQADVMHLIKRCA